MPETLDLLTPGAPAFTDRAVARIAREQGIAAAWQQALTGDAATALSQVQGRFALALRYPNSTAHLAVDRFAIETLCYRVVNGKLHFAARADALVDPAFGPVPAIDPQAVFDYLFFHAIPSPRTIFKGVFRVPPGHLATWDGREVSVKPYWVPKFEEPASVSFDALRDEFRGHLKASVQRELGDGVPACFLSGGTDSSTVAGMIREATGQAAACYSIGFEAEGYDEMAFARLAAKRFGAQHHEYYVTPDDLQRSIGDVAGQFDQPFGNSSALPAYYCAKVARADGVTKMLAGDGGDELFGGNSRYAKMRIFGLYDHLPGALRRGVMEPLFGLPVMAKIPLLSKGASYIEQAKVPMPDRLQMYNLVTRLGLADIVPARLLAQMDLDDPARAQRAVWAMQPASTSDINAMLAFDWRYTLAESDLPKVLGATRLADMAVGFPFLDPAMLDFSLRLPSRYKLKGLKLRWFFKEALRGFLPDEIISKKKQGFGLPFGVWANRHAGLKALATESLHGLAERGYVRADFVQRLLTELLPSFPGYYGEMVWILMTLEQWLRRHAPDAKA